VVVGKHGIQTFEVVIVMLLLILLSPNVLVSRSAHFLSIFNLRFAQICLVEYRGIQLE
jgi:hypothetical protein